MNIQEGLESKIPGKHFNNPGFREPAVHHIWHQRQNHAKCQHRHNERHRISHIGPPAGQLLELFRRDYPVVRGDDDAEQVLAQHQDTATAEELIGRLDLAIAENKWLLVAGHGIRTELGREAEADPNFRKNGKRRDGYRPVEYPVMEALCKAVDRQRDKLFVGCYGDVGRYVRERNAARITIVEQSADEIVLEVTHELDPDVFDLPLTLKLTLTDTEGVIVASQGKQILNVTMRGNASILNVVPNSDPVTIQLNENPDN